MGNMSYCRFQNTVGDLRDCQGALEELLAGDGKLSREELSAAIRLVETCQEIISEVAGRSEKAQKQIDEFGAIDDTEVNRILTEANNEAAED